MKKKEKIYLYGYILKKDESMENRTFTSFCRICAGCCGLKITVDENDKILDVRGDKDNAMTKGYACFKGLAIEDTHHSKARLLQPLKRQGDGSFAPIPLEEALDEIAQRLKDIISRGGVDAVGLFAGGAGVQNSSAYAMQKSFMSTLGSSQSYSTVTIDQSAKLVSFERMGGWAAGLPGLDQSDVLLLIATNPLVSLGAIGSLLVDPARRLKRAKARGLKLIVIDPRRTETARHADLFVQPLPGQDAAIAAALLRIILDQEWYDKDFCARYVGEEGLQTLRMAVEPFTSELVEERAKLESGQLRAVAEMFARDNKRGHAMACTGTNMSPFSNVAQHMVDCLNVVCGRFRRPGDQVVVDMLSPEMPVRAEVIAPPRSWQAVCPSRIRGVGRLFGEKLSGTLAEEILTPGVGQIKALIVDGANIANAMPDHARMVEALHSLELLVCIEPYMTVTARFAHYIFPPKLQFERADLPSSVSGFTLMLDNFSQYAPAVLNPPKGSTVIDDWYFFWSIAKRLGLQIIYDGKTPLDMNNEPTTDELLSIRLTGARVSLKELKQYPSGKMFEPLSGVVIPGEQNGAKFDVMPDDVADELRQFFDEVINIPDDGVNKNYKFLLSCRRMQNMFCTLGTHLDSFLKKTPENPMLINPVDLQALRINSGETVNVLSEHGRITAIARADETMKPGVISIAHGWGGQPGDDVASHPCVNRLIDSTRSEAVNAMPWMSAIPVNVLPL